MNADFTNSHFQPSSPKGRSQKHIVCKNIAGNPVETTLYSEPSTIPSKNIFSFDFGRNDLLTQWQSNALLTNKRNTATDLVAVDTLNPKSTSFLHFM
jgi:hypothetical protein